MSAAVMLRQSGAIHIAVDAAVYHRDGVIAAFINKAHALPKQRCAITTLGASLWNEIAIPAIRDRFDSYDEMKVRLAPFLRELYDKHAHKITNEDVWNAGDVWVAGWSDALDKPDGFWVCMYDPTKIKGMSADDRAPFLPHEMMPTFGLNMHPCPSGAQLYEAFPTISLMANYDYLDPEVDLLKILEVQRRMPFNGGFYAVGGYALLTTVTRETATQKRIHTWTEDRIGELIRPAPVNWSQRARRKSEPHNSVTAAIVAAEERRSRKQAKRAAIVARNWESADA